MILKGIEVFCWQFETVNDKMIMENNFARLTGQVAKDKEFILLDSPNKKMCFPYSLRHYLQLPKKTFPTELYLSVFICNAVLKLIFIILLFKNILLSFFYFSGFLFHFELGCMAIRKFETIWVLVERFKLFSENV